MDTIRVDFENEFQRLAQGVGQITSVKDLWKSIKEALLASSDATCGWTREPPRYRVNCWCTENVDRIVKEKCRFWKRWKKGGSKEVSFEA